MSDGSQWTRAFCRRDRCPVLRTQGRGGAKADDMFFFIDGEEVPGHYRDGSEEYFYALSISVTSHFLPRNRRALERRRTRCARLGPFLSIRFHCGGGAEITFIKIAEAIPLSRTRECARR